MVLRPLDAGGMSGMTLRGSLRVSPIRPGRRASRGSGAGAGISGSPAGGRRTADQWDHFADNCVLPGTSRDDEPHPWLDAWSETRGA